ncbi:MAG: SusC/RagA family TonB-linked outer membrane protein [Pedobacter sp.]|nr:MAG: SusC/RagA family TonB-linked outer membrane protein [Pedobacter sp.]
MTKKYILKQAVFAMLFLAIAERSTAQTTGRELTDTIKAGRMEPGRLFKTTKINSTAAVSTVYGETLYKTPTMNLMNTLYGRLPGLTVNQGSGEPGYDDASLGIRGVGSFGRLSNSGLNTYKVFIDGFETNSNNFSYLSAAEIESVSILKDAAALATFGMRGSNGVIYVITKRGKVGKPTITFQTRTGLQRAVNIYKPLNSFEYATLYNQANSNDKGNIWTPTYSPAQLQGYQNGTLPDVDWYAEVLKKQSPYTDADLNFNGGDENARYNIVLNYANQQALYDVKQTDATSNSVIKRYNLRSNLDFKMFNIFEAKVDIGGRLEDRKAPNYSGGSLWQNLARYPSNIYQVKDGPTGNYSGTSLYPDNPVASLNSLGWFSSHRRILQGNFSLKERLDELVPGLYLSQAYSFNSYSQSNYSKTADYPRYFNGLPGGPTNVLVPLRATGLAPGGQQDWKQLMATVGYEQAFGKHQLISAINYHQSDYRGDGEASSYIYHYQNVSGRANYNYDERYTAEFGFSYFGADGYAPGNRWGFYPALSASWVVSNEDFLKQNKIISLLKIRASAGKSGGMDSETQNSGRFLYQQYYNNSGTFYTGNASVAGNTGLTQTTLANPDIFAEKSMKYNIGAEISLFKKLDLAVDVFLDKRSGIITRDNSIPGFYGAVNRFANLGEVTNKGFEATASFSDKVGGFGYTVFGSASFNKNNIDYMAEIPLPYDYNQQTGRPIGTTIGLVATGFYQLSDFNANGTLKSGIASPAFGVVQPGDLRYQDLNADNIVDEKDVTAIGKSIFPTLTYSFGTNFNYRGFDASALFQGISGSSVNILGAAGTQVQAFVGNGNAYSIAQGAWAYYPDQGIDTRATATYPRLTTAANNNNYRTSSFWQKSRDFLRLRNVELGYTFSTGVVKSLGISNLRIYVNAVNPLSWSSLQRDYHFDPETLSGYPALKSFNTGLSVTF